MKALKIIILASFITPTTLGGQSNSIPQAPDGIANPPDMVIAQGPQSEARPPLPPGQIAVRTGGRIGGVAGPGGMGPVRFEPPAGEEFGPGGAWWKNSEIVTKVQLTDEQVKKISQTYLDHKLKLIDLQADLEKQELRLQPLMDVDQPDETNVGAQIDLITAARGKLEKENAMMMLDIRRWLSVEQWKKLKALQAAEPPRREVFYFRGGPGGRGEGLTPPPPPDDTPVRAPK